MRGLTIALGLAAVLSAAEVRAADGRWVFSTGVDYTQGDYGETDDTTIVTVPFVAGYAADRWSASLTVPFVSVDGPGTIVPGGFGGGPLGGLLGSATPASPLGGVNATGLGDISASLSFAPLVLSEGGELTIGGRVRAPTADADRALGTGEWTAALEGGWRQPLGKRAAVFGSVGYQQAFESDGSGVFAGVGAESYVAERVQLGATLDFAQAASTLQRDAAQAGAYVTYDVAPATRLQAYGAAGLSETSPDVSAGLRVVFGVD